MAGTAEVLQRQRTVALADEIKRRFVDSIETRLLELCLASDEEITLLIDSAGGDSFAGLALHDFIVAMKAPVRGVVVGFCESAAVPVLQACRTRFALPNARLFLHHNIIQYSFSIYRGKEQAKLFLERRWIEAMQTQEAFESIIARRAKKSLEEIRCAMGQGDAVEYRFSAQEALAFGLIDGIEDYQSTLLQSAHS